MSVAVTFHDHMPDAASLREEVLQGLATTPKAIPPKFFYDEAGSKLFDRICLLPEYYPTRTEMAILESAAAQIAQLAGTAPLLIELGSGASRKVRLLLEALRPAAYLGVDISRDFLLASTQRLAEDYPWLEVHAACADFSQNIRLPYARPDVKKLAFFPGSSIGNFDPDDARRLLQRLAARLQPDGALLIGVDLRKPTAILDAAYNDTRGVTAAFNRNLLVRMREELRAEVDVDAFHHHAFFNEDQSRVEMHLVSRRPQTIAIDRQYFEFEHGESIHTENSYKYTVGSFQALAAEAGYRPVRVWTDAQQLFSVHYLVLASAGS